MSLKQFSKNISKKFGSYKNPPYVCHVIKNKHDEHTRKQNRAIKHHEQHNRTRPENKPNSWESDRGHSQQSKDAMPTAKPKHKRVAKQDGIRSVKQRITKGG
jgi:hypothetical protein